jgi:GNAT superfamily N-acetyltransferase
MANLPNTAIPNPISLPLSPAVQDPLFGVNLYGAGTNMFFASQLEQNTSDVLAYRAQKQQALFNAAQAAVANAMIGQSVFEPDPSQWTPESAAAQTDRALAKLATINPELAAQLAAEREGKSGEGIFDIIKGVFSPIGKALDLLFGTAYIIPNMVFDIVDGGEFSPGKNFVGAFTGEVRHNWNAVFQQMGWKGDGIGGIARAILGFIGDVATDPITWLFLGTGGLVKAEARAGLVAAKAATESEGILKLARGVERFAKATDEEIVTHLRGVWEGVIHDVGHEALRYGNIDVFERAAALTNASFSAAENELYKTLFEVGSKTYDLVRTRTLRHAVQKGLVLSEKGVVSAKDVKELLETAIRNGAFKNPKDPLWRQATIFADALGGVRLRVRVPFTSFRYISPPTLYGRLGPFMLGGGLDMVSRFFAGQSGMVRLVHEIGMGNATWEHLRYWMDEGWTSFMKQFPDLGRRIAGNGMHFGSMFYSTAERLSAITAVFDRGAAMTRHGLAGYMAWQARLEADSAGNDFVHNTIRRVLGEDASLNDDFHKTFGIHADEKLTTATEEVKARISEYLDWFPEDLDPGNWDEFKQWLLDTNPGWGDLINSVEPAGSGLHASYRFVDDPEAHDFFVRMQRMWKTAQSFTPEERRVLKRMGVVLRIAGEEASKHGVHHGNVKFAFDEALGLHPSQVKDWQYGRGMPHPATQVVEEAGKKRAPKIYYLHIEDPDIRQQILTGGQRLDAAATIDEFSGIKVYEKKIHPDDIPVAIRGEDFVELDAMGNGVLPTEVAPNRTIHDAREEIDKYLDELAKKVTKATASAKEESLLDLVEATGVDVFRQEYKEKTVAESLTKEIRARRANAAGIIRPLEDGNKAIYIFDPTDVKLVSEEFPVLRPHRGYYHRVLKKEVAEAIRGRIPKDEPQILLAEPQLQAELNRTLPYDLKTSSDMVKEMLADKLGIDPSMLPDIVWDTNPMVSYTKYLHDQALAIRSRILGRTSQRLMTLSRFAPFMFSAAPKTQEYRWTISPGVMKYIITREKELVEKVLAANKRAIKYMQAQKKQFNFVAEEMGRLTEEVEGRFVQKLGPPDEEVAAILRWGRNRAEAQQAITKARPELEGRLAQLDEEEKLVSRVLDQATGRLADIYKKTSDGRPDIPGHIKAALDKFDRQIDRLTSPGAPEPHKLMLKKHDPNIATDLGDGVWRLGEPHSIPGASTIKQWAQLGTAPNIPPVTYYYVDESGKILGTKRIAYSPIVKSDTFVLPEARGRGIATKLANAFFRDLEDISKDRIASFDRIIENYLEKNSFTPGGAAATKKALREFYPEHINRRLDAVRKVIEDMMDRGELYYRKELDSVFTKTGSFVRKGGGRRLISPTELQLEREQLQKRLEDLNFVQEILDRSLRPVEPETGRFLPVVPPDPNRPKWQHRNPLELAGSRTEKALGSRSAAAQKHNAAIKEGMEISKRLERARVELVRATNALNKALAEAQQARAKLKPALIEVPLAGGGKNVAAEATDTLGLQGLTRLRVPGLESYAMPSYIAEEFHSMIDRHGVGHLRQEWRRFVLGPWKRWATYRWPGFHARNFFGAWFNNWLGGVMVADYAFSYKVNNEKFFEKLVTPDEFKRYRLGLLFGEDNVGSLTYGDIRDHLARLGVGEGNTRSVAEAANTVDEAWQIYTAAAAKDKTKLRRGFERFDNRMRNIGASVEEFHRTAAWAHGMAITNGDTYGARAFVMMRHGDYADLTPAEDYIRDLVPFYKWLRTNVPYQIRALAAEPGKMTLVAGKLERTAYDIAGFDEQKARASQPQFLREALAIPIPDWVPVIGSKGQDNIKYAILDLPFNDLYNGLNDYISATLPVVRNLLESYAIKQQVFTGKPLEGKLVRLSGVWNTPGIRDVLKMTGIAKADKDGNLFIDDRLENVLTAWPIYSRFRNFMEADPARVEARMGGLFSMIAGIGIRPDNFVQAELDFFYNEVEPVLQQYRQLGVRFPQAREFVDAADAIGATPIKLDLPTGDEPLVTLV